MKKDFLDIIHLTRPYSSRPKMSITDRAAQFSPFAALTGHEDAIVEKARLTEKRKILDKEQIDTLNKQLNYLLSHPDNNITITYFIQDRLKDGGKYITIKTKIKKIDIYQKYILIQNHEKIAFEDLYKIEAKCFEYI